VTYAIRSLSRWMRLLFAVFSTCFSLTLFLAETWAQPMKQTVSYTGVGPVNLPVVLAKQAGIFTRNGLDVTVVRAQAAVSTMALISGEVGFIQAAAPA
jgi:ABC-type nitrate/sulfonate/bicarbonate transport system substrate-binding protein